MKETFIIRTEWYEAISELSDADRLILFDNLFLFHKGEKDKINLNNLTVKLVWKLIEPDLLRNIDKYDKRCETSARNGSLGGRPRKNEEPNNNLNKPKKADGLNKEPNNPDIEHDLVLVYDIEHDLDKKKEIEKKPVLIFPYSSKKFLDLWEQLLKTPKWKKKIPHSLQLALDKLKDFEEDFSINLLEQAIIGEWQGLVFQDTKDKYDSWKKSKGKAKGGGVVSEVSTVDYGNKLEEAKKAEREEKEFRERNRKARPLIDSEAIKREMTPDELAKAKETLNNLPL